MKSSGILKRFLCLTLVLVFLSMNLSTAFASSKKSYYVNTHGLYVRTGPSSSYSSTDKLKRNTVVTRYSQKNNWYYVKYDGGEGWVYKGYLSNVKSSSSGSYTSSATYKTTTGLRVRSEASTDGAVIDKLKKGTKVTIKKQKGSWVYVSYSGGSGWVATKYLKKAK